VLIEFGARCTIVRGRWIAPNAMTRQMDCTPVPKPLKRFSVNARGPRTASSSIFTDGVPAIRRVDLLPSLTKREGPCQATHVYARTTPVHPAERALGLRNSLQTTERTADC
jgi:hypothetical protein